MGSRKAIGAWRSNYLNGKLNLKDGVSGIVRIAQGRWHAGGMSVSGDLLAVPIYSTGKTVDKISSAIRFFHLKNPLAPESLSVNIVRKGETAGAVAMVRIPTNGRLLVAVWSDADKHLPRRLDFYLSKSNNILDGFEDVSKEWLASDVKSAGNLKPNFSNFQNTNIIVEEKNGNYKLFLIGTHNTKFLSLGKDFADLFEISFEDDSVFDQQPTLTDVTVTKVAKKEFPNAHFQFHFAAAGGIQIDPSGALRLYSSYYWKYDNVLKFAEFRSEIDVVASDISDINNSWIELFEHNNFKGRRLSARDIRTAEFADFEHVYVQGEPYEVGVSSLRYQIPLGKKYRLYESENFKGRHIDLVGTGRVEEMSDLGDASFQDRASSSKLLG